MEKINFTQNSELKKYENVLKWIKLSGTLLGIITTILSFISITQATKLRAIKQEITEQKLEITDLNKILKTKAKLKKQKASLKAKLASINKIKNAPKKEFDILLNIYKVASKETNLQLINVTKNEIIISGQSKNDKLITNLSKKISRLPYVKSAKMVSMQKNNNIFTFQIKGELKT